VNKTLKKYFLFTYYKMYSSKRRRSNRKLKSKRKPIKRSSTKRTKRTKRSSTKRSSTKRIRRQRGGSGYGHGPAVLVGAPYNAADANPHGNYYAYNERVEAWPVPSNSQFGTQSGGRRRKSKYKQSKYKQSKYKQSKYKKQRGGGISEFITTLLPEELVNIGRAVPASVGHMYDRFNGSLSSPSSLVYPTQQPLAHVSTGASTSRMMTPPDLVKFYNTNNNNVSRI
jgi:hypothetical protein